MSGRSSRTRYQRMGGVGPDGAPGTPILNKRTASWPMEVRVSAQGSHTRLSPSLPRARLLFRRGGGSEFDAQL